MFPTICLSSCPVQDRPLPGQLEPQANSRVGAHPYPQTMLYLEATANKVTTTSKVSCCPSIIQQHAMLRGERAPCCCTWRGTRMEEKPFPQFLRGSPLIAPVSPALHLPDKPRQCESQFSRWLPWVTSLCSRYSLQK